MGWIAHAKQYFEINNTVAHLKVSLAMVAMDGAPLHWLRQCKPDLTWPQLTYKLLLAMDNSFEYLAAVQQTGSVAEYINESVMRVAQVPLLPDAHSLGYFLNGLRVEIVLDCIPMKHKICIPQ